MRETRRLLICFLPLANPRRLSYRKSIAGVAEIGGEAEEPRI